MSPAPVLGQLVRLPPGATRQVHRPFVRRTGFSPHSVSVVYVLAPAFQVLVTERAPCGIMLSCRYYLLGVTTARLPVGFCCERGAQYRTQPLTNVVAILPVSRKR